MGFFCVFYVLLVIYINLELILFCFVVFKRCVVFFICKNSIIIFVFFFVNNFVIVLLKVDGLELDNILIDFVM